MVDMSLLEPNQKGDGALLCTCCGAPMKMSGADNRFEFACTGCRQHQIVDHGRVSCIIMAHLYPSNMDERSRMYQEYLDWKLAEAASSLKATLLCGAMSAGDFDRHISEWRDVVDKERERIAALPPIPLPKRWWTRLWQSAA